MSKPPIIFSPRWWRLLSLIVREHRQQPKSLAVPHSDYAGPVLDPNRVLLGRDLASAEVSVREDHRVSVKLVCEDGSYVTFGLEEKP